MKNLSTIFITMLLASVILISCKKSSTSSTPNNGTHITGRASVIMDGNSNPLTGSTYNCGMATDSELIINTDAGSDYVLDFAIPMSSMTPAVGVYNNGRIAAYYLLDGNVNDSYYSTSLTLDIVSYDPSTGDFSATYSGVISDGIHTHNLTNGTINGVISKN